MGLRLFKPKEVADKTGIHVSTVIRAARRGDLPYVPAGKTYKFTFLNLCTWLGKEAATELFSEDSLDAGCADRGPK